MLLDIAKVSQMLGVSVPTAWRYVREKPEFPQGVKLSRRCRRWTEAEIMGFVEKQRQPA